MKMELLELTMDQLLVLENELKNAIYQSLDKDRQCIECLQFVCKHCGSTDTIKAGFNRQKKQQYKCKCCSKRMISGRDSLTFSSKKEFSQWVLFIESLLNGDPLVISASKARISKRTAFRWRHKTQYILISLLNQEVLTTEVYLDETLLNVSFKNANHAKLEKIKKRGMSSDKVNITCAIDTSGRTFMKVTDRGRMTSKSLIECYSGMIKPGSIVVSDSLRSYHKLMPALNVEWKKIPSKSKSVESYTLEPINHLHALFKDFIYQYKGVSLKYLQGYVALFDYKMKHKYYHERKVFFGMINQIMQCSGHIRCSDIDQGIITM